MRTHSACQVFGLAWLPCCMQVRWDNQSQYPEVTIQVTIESFVGQSSIGLLCPSAAASTTAQNTCLAKTLSLESGCTHTKNNKNRQRHTHTQRNTHTHTRASEPTRTHMPQISQLHRQRRVHIDRQNRRVYPLCNWRQRSKHASEKAVCISCKLVEAPTE